MMLFSEYFAVDKNIIEEYGAVDISLTCDLPFFIDPMLIFQSNEQSYIDLHSSMIKYFCFLAEKSLNGFTEDEIDKYFNFSEIKNNWFGYSLVGNQGSGLGKKFARFLSANICKVVENKNISNGIHIEKTLLFYSGNGKDKISDLAANLIFKYLIDYTAAFAKTNIDKSKIYSFECMAEFDYETEAFRSEFFDLPFIINRKGKKEFVILTPRNMLRKDDPSINRKDFENSFDKIRNSIQNSQLRANLDNYITAKVNQYMQSIDAKKAKDAAIYRIEKAAFLAFAQEVPEIYDYYVKLKEGEDISPQTELECKEIIEKFILNSQKMIEVYNDNHGIWLPCNSVKEELISRVKYFKHIIEDCDCYKCLYYNGKRISSEDDLNRMFRLVWYNTVFDVNYDANNGRGEYDVAVSSGAKNKILLEFKLASNPRLSHAFDQTKVYEKASCTKDSFHVIFYFDANELTITQNMLKEQNMEENIDKTIFLIDCRCDNKVSASKI